MINIKEELKKNIIKVIEKHSHIKVNFSDINVDVPNNLKFGDYSSNAAMKFSKKLNIPPKELGEIISKGLLNSCDFIDKINIMGPGFINIYIKKDHLIKNTVENIEKDLSYRPSSNKNKAIKVCIVLDELVEIFRPRDFRAFMNMYYLGNLYELKGYKAEKTIVMKKSKNDIKALYLLANFKHIQKSCRDEELKDSIVFCSPENQWLFKDNENKRLIVNDVKIYGNNIEMNNIDLVELIETIGLDRLMFTMMKSSINSEVHIEMTRNDLEEIQYPYSRISTIIKIFEEEGLSLEDIEVFKWELLQGPLFKDLILKLTQYQETIESCISLNDPHKLIKYGEELNDSFNQLDTNILYRNLERDRLIVLLKLYSAVKLVMKEILTILEVPIYERM